MSLALLIAGGLVYATYIAHGGFYADDWATLGSYHTAHSPQLWTTVSAQQAALGGRPMLALLLPLPDAVFGAHPALYLGLALAIGIATSLSLYLLLRTLSMPPPHAGAIAILALLFPWSDSLRLWETAAIVGVSVCLFFLGLTIRIRALRRSGRRALAMNIGAGALYLVSVLTYEAGAGPALVAGLLYFRFTSRLRAARWWLADAIVVLAALGYSLSATVSARHVGTISERIRDIPKFAHDAFLLFAWAILPVRSPSVLVQGIVLLAAAAIAGLALLRIRQGSNGEIRAWLWWLLTGVVAIGATYFMFLGSHLHPLDPGIDTRINLFSGPAYCLAAYAILVLASRCLLGSRRLAPAIAVGAGLVVAVGYGLYVRGDETAWRRASVLQRPVLAALDRAIGPLPPSSTLLTFNHPAQTAPEVPIFDKDFDLRGALRFHDNDRMLSGLPVYTGVTVRCQPTRVSVIGPGDYGSHQARYGSVFFLNVAASVGKRISSAGQCTRALRSFPPGKLR